MRNNNLCLTLSAPLFLLFPLTDNARRRTPGGVYMQLIKTDSNLTKEQRKKIFEDDRRLYNKKQKEMRKLTYAQRNRWREKNEAEAGKIAAKWRGDMEDEDEKDEEEERRKEINKRVGGDEMEADEGTAAASNAAAAAGRLSSIDDEFVDDEFGEIDAVKDAAATSGFGHVKTDVDNPDNEDASEFSRERRRTPSPIDDDLFF